MKRTDEHRPLLRRLVAAVATTALGLGLLMGVTGTSTAATTPASNGAAALMTSYDAGTGLIGNGWWTSAVAMSTVMTYQQRTGDAQYQSTYETTFNKNKSHNFTNDYLDDTGWWALAWIQAYDITGNASYLQMARTDAEYMHGYWDSTCGGGIYWSTAKSYKNAIPNELFLQVTAGLHNRIPGDTTYLGWANAEWNWFNGSGMINSSHLVNDGLTSACQNNNDTTWTYNQGVILSGLAELYKATGNSGLLATGTSIADAATSRLSKNGILTEPCEPNCGADGPAFKGIFIRDLRAFATAARSTAYDGFLTAQANSIIAHDTDGSGQFGLVWAGPVQSVSYSTTAAGEDALVAALPGSGSGTPTPTGPVTSGVNAGKCLDDFGASTTAGAKVDLWDCNGSSAQTWTVTGGTLRASGLCLDVTGAGTANGTLVELWTCNGGANQQWQPSNGTLVNPASGKCLDDPGFDTTNGTQLDIWTCDGGANQRWALPAA
ncbi:glycoside hydrolase family 76 protein [Streptomyces sp. AcH 505]|uniref:glycoside hydrolase family 76 protein n=1 Tax=Streptomyces sp. AcH 505 TaxID=352211 RepID=UPI00099D32F7